MENVPALTETVFYILLTLKEPTHGYAIMQNIRQITADRIRMGAGTLYGALRALLEKGYIREIPSGDPSKRQYIRTELGTTVLRAEVCRLQELLSNADRYFREENDT